MIYDIDCTGSEQTLGDCPHNGINDHLCQRREAASLICQSEYSELVHFTWSGNHYKIVSASSRLELYKGSIGILNYFSTTKSLRIIYLTITHSQLWPCLSFNISECFWEWSDICTKYLVLNNLYILTREMYLIVGSTLSEQHLQLAKLLDYQSHVLTC